MEQTLTIVFPGQDLGDASAGNPGPGTYIRNGRICASLAGTLHTTTSSAPTPKDQSSQASRHSKDAQQPAGAHTAQVTTYTVTATPRPQTASTSAVLRRRPLLPSINSIVLGRIVRLTNRQATLLILAIESDDPSAATTSGGSSSESPKSFLPCPAPFPALLRQQDVRATEKDKVRLPQAFRIGDIVRAIVISLGDQASYYLSTARNDLGVVMAWTAPEDSSGFETDSALGEQLLPINWNEMMAAASGKTETRKVAKPL